MVTALIASFILLAAISFAIYRSRQNALPDDDANKALPPPPPNFKGLFETDGEHARLEALQLEKERTEKRQALLARAAAGEKAALLDAHTFGDKSLYEEILNTLVGRAENDKQLLALASYITRNESLQVNGELAGAFLESWKLSPNRRTTPQMLHLTALAGDASLYQQAIEAMLGYWREEKLPGMAAAELVQLAESEFWILPSEARNSGAGFLLKQELARIRRELAAHKTVTSDE